VDVAYDDTEHLERHHKVMNTTPVQKTWTVPRHGTFGPVRMTMRMPDVTVTDGEGRSIVLTPQQSTLLGLWLTDAMDWLRDLEDNRTIEG
jgi:hypothetical protein